jgi:hypothetical protein
MDAYSVTKGNWDAMAAISGFFAVVLLFILIAISWPEGKRQR